MKRLHKTSLRCSSCQNTTQAHSAEQYEKIRRKFRLQPRSQPMMRASWTKRMVLTLQRSNHHAKIRLMISNSWTLQGRSWSPNLSRSSTNRKRNNRKTNGGFTYPSLQKHRWPCISLTPLSLALNLGTVVDCLRIAKQSKIFLRSIWESRKKRRHRRLLIGTQTSSHASKPTLYLTLIATQTYPECKVCPTN